MIGDRKWGPMPNAVGARVTERQLDDIDCDGCA